LSHPAMSLGTRMNLIAGCPRPHLRGSRCRRRVLRRRTSTRGHDEVMSDATRALIDISAALAGGSAGRLDSALRAAVGVADAAAVEEALLQSYLFLGYPSALRGLAAWRRISELPAPAEAARDGAEWADRGASICARVYG